MLLRSVVTSIWLLVESQPVTIQTPWGFPLWSTTFEEEEGFPIQVLKATVSFISVCVMGSTFGCLRLVLQWANGMETQTWWNYLGSWDAIRIQQRLFVKGKNIDCYIFLSPSHSTHATKSLVMYVHENWTLYILSQCVAVIQRYCTKTVLCRCRTSKVFLLCQASSETDLERKTYLWLIIRHYHWYHWYPEKLRHILRY